MTEIKAPITGCVWKILVTEGDAVESDQTIVLLESMKLEIPVEADRAGTVARVAVAVGDVVVEDDVLVVLEH